MTNDVIEVCSRCGKMPRGIDLSEAGLFRCTRCGNNALTTVTNSDYEKIVTELDQKYHAEVVRMRIANVRLTQPIKTRAARAKAKKRPAAKKARKPAKRKR